MIVKLPDIHANNAQCKVFFTFNSEFVNKAASAQSGSWNSALTYNLIRKFGSASADLAATAASKSFTFTSPLPVGASTYVSCYVYLTSTPTPEAAACVWNLFNSANDRIYLFADTSRRFKVTAFSGGGIVSDALYSSAKSTGQWYYVQAFITATNLYLLIDKELITYTLSSPVAFNAISVNLNSTGSATNNIFTGLLDSFMVKTGVSVPISTLYNIKNRES